MGTAVLGNLQEFLSASVTCWIIHQPDGRVRKWDQIYFLLQLQVLITLIRKKDGLRFKGLGRNLGHLIQFSIWPWLSGYILAHYLGPLFFKMLGHSYTKFCRTQFIIQHVPMLAAEIPRLFTWIHQQSWAKWLLDHTVRGQSPAFLAAILSLKAYRLRSLEQVWGPCSGVSMLLSDILLFATTFLESCNTNKGDSSGKGRQAGTLLSCHPWNGGCNVVALTVPKEITYSQVLVLNFFPVMLLFLSFFWINKYVLHLMFLQC